MLTISGCMNLMRKKEWKLVRSTDQLMHAEFTSAIASVSRVAVLQYLASCNFMSVIVDGSSNSSFTENEMVYMMIG